MGVLDDVRFEDGERVIEPPVSDQGLAELLNRGGSDPSQPDRLADGPRLVGELLERVPDPSIERSGDRRDIAVSRLELGARQGGVDGGIQSVPADRRLQRVLADEAAKAGHRGTQRATRDLEHPAEPLGPHRGRHVDSEHTEETALRRTRQLDHLASHSEHLHGAEHSDGGLGQWHRQSVAQR